MISSLPLSVVALLTAGDVPTDALRATAEALREFGVRVVEVADPAGDAASPRTANLQAAAGEEWRAVIVASTDAVLPAAVADAVPVPVIRVPVAGAAKSGLALLQTDAGDLPAATRDGVSFATVAIGPAGARNAALFVVSVLALKDDGLREAWNLFRARQTAAVLQLPPPTLAETLPADP